MKSGKLLWGAYLFFFIGTIISKFCNIKVIGLAFSGGLCILSTVLMFKGIGGIKERQNRKAFNWWWAQHVTVIPESKEFIITVEDKIEECEEEIIYKIEDYAIKIGYKVTIKSPLSEVIDQYYS